MVTRQTRKAREEDVGRLPQKDNPLLLSFSNFFFSVLHFKSIFLPLSVFILSILHGMILLMMLEGRQMSEDEKKQRDEEKKNELKRNEGSFKFICKKNHRRKKKRRGRRFKERCSTLSFFFFSPLWMSFIPFPSPSLLAVISFPCKSWKAWDAMRWIQEIHTFLTPRDCSSWEEYFN